MFMETEVFISKSWMVRTSQVVTIPKKIRNELDIGPNDSFLVGLDGRRIILEPIDKESFRKGIEEGRTSPNAAPRAISPSSCTPNTTGTNASTHSKTRRGRDE